MSTVEVTRQGDSRYTAVHTVTGASGEGETEADALEALVESLRHIQRDVDDPHTAFDRVTARVQQRVREQETDEDIVEDAIEWARSQ